MDQGASRRYYIKDLRDNVKALDEFSRCMDPKFKSLNNWEHMAFDLDVPRDVIRACKQYYSPTIKLFQYLEVKRPSMTIGELRAALTKDQQRCRKDLDNILQVNLADECNVSETITNSATVILDKLALELDSASKKAGNWEVLGLNLGITRDKLKEFEMCNNHNPTEELFRVLYATSAKKVELNVIVRYLEQMDGQIILDEIRRIRKSADMSAAYAEDYFKIGSDLLATTSRFLNDDSLGLKGWKGLANSLISNGYIDDPDIITKLEPQHESHSPTEEIIEWLTANKPDLTISDLIVVCKNISRSGDAVQILTKYFPDESLSDLQLQQLSIKPHQKYSKTEESARQPQKLNKKELLVDKQGGLYDIPSHGLFLQVPKDTFNEKTHLTVNHLSGDVVPSPAKDMEAVVSFMIALGPTDAILQKPVTITIMHSGPEGMPEYENIVMALDEKTQEWEQLQGIECNIIKSVVPTIDGRRPNFIQAQLNKLTTVTVVSRLITDSFQVPVTGCHVSSSVCHDVTLEFLEGAVDKTIQGSLKVLPASSVMPKDMANVHLSPMVIVDGFEGFTLSKAAILTLPNPCPSKRPASEIHVMCFEKNKWREITESVKYSEISESRIEIRIDHFSIFQIIFNAPQFRQSLAQIGDFFKWWSGPPQSVLFAVHKLKNLGDITDNFKLTLSCLPCYMGEKLEKLFPTERYDKLASESSTMKENDEALIEIAGDFESCHSREVILKLEKNVYEKELNIKKKHDINTERREKKVEISFLSKECGRNLGQLIVYERQLGIFCPGGLQLKVNPNDKDVYMMKSSPRGVVVIINIVRFDAPNLPERKGSKKDDNDLKNLFIRHLNFKNIKFGNNYKSRNLILRRLKQIAGNDKYRAYDCLAVCILSHGDEGFFYASNGSKVKIKQVYTIFSNTKSAAFRNKPKLFFIQACRQTSGSELSVQSRSDPPAIDMADLLIAYPCCPGFPSLRNTVLGSYFIQSIVKVFREDAREHNIVKMMTRVTREVRARIRQLYPGYEGAQVPMYESTLQKMLYFWPDITF